jgi:hypothetical protein
VLPVAFGAGKGATQPRGRDRALDAPIVTALGTRADLTALMGVYLMGVPLLAECSDHWAWLWGVKA